MTRERDDSFTDDLDRKQRIREASATTGARGEDIRTRDAMEGGASGSSPEIPAGELDAADVANARKTARGGLGAGPVGVPGEPPYDSDPGAPWDDLDDAMRMPQSDPNGPDWRNSPRGT